MSREGPLDDKPAAEPSTAAASSSPSTPTANDKVSLPAVLVHQAGPSTDTKDSHHHNNIGKDTLSAAPAEAKGGNRSSSGNSSSLRHLSRASQRMVAGQSLSEAAARELSTLGTHSSHSLTSEGISIGLRDLHVASFSTASLTIVWVLNVMGALGCSVLAEVYQSSYPTFPLSFVVFIGCHLSILSFFVVYLLGRKRFGNAHFHLYQPFRGGQRFVLMQFFGLLHMFLYILCTLAYTATVDPHKPRRGVLTVLGCAGLLGNSLIWLSLRYFELPSSSSAAAATSSAARTSEGTAAAAGGGADEREADSLGARLLATLRTSPNTETALVCAMMTGQFVLSGVGTAFPLMPVYVSRLNLLVQLVVGYLIHFHIGHKHTEGFGCCTLRLRRRIDTAVYWALLLLYAISLAVDGRMIWLGNDVSPLTLLVVPVVNTLSTGMYLLFVRTTSFKASTRASYSTIFDYGGLTVVISAVVTSVVNMGFMLCMQYYPDEVVLAGREGGGGGDAWSTHELLTVCLVVSQLFLMILSPLMDIAGRIIEDEDFSIFHAQSSFTTSTLIQAAGWFFYTSSIVSFALYLSTKDPRTCVLATAGALLSVVLLAFAIRIYSAHRARMMGTITQAGMFAPAAAATAVANGEQTSEGAAPTTTTAAAETRRGGATTQPEEYAEEAEPPLKLTYVLNGEMMISYLMALSALMLDGVVDTAMQRIWGNTTVPVTQLMFISDLLFLAAVPLAHFSARDKGVYVFVPFAGSGRFVALQALAWMTYTLFALLAMVMGISAIGRPEVVQASILALSHHHIYRSMFGVLRLIPMMLITLSIAIESHVMMRRLQLKMLALDSFHCVRALVADAMEGKTENEKAILQLAFRTLAEPTLQYYDLLSVENMLRVLPTSPTGTTTTTTTTATTAKEKKNEGDAANNEASSGSSLSSSQVLPSSDAATAAAAAAGGGGGGGARNTTAEAEPQESDESQGDSAAEAREKARQHERMRVILILLCSASATFYVLAAFLYRVTVISLAFAVCGALVSTLSCVGIHAGYGMIVHARTGCYAPFMPFKGGRDYLLWQVVGWWCYAGIFIVTLAASLEAEQVSPLALVVAALLSVLSQICIFNSIPVFSARQDRLSFLEENGEGIVALCAFTGAFIFTYIYDALARFFFGGVGSEASQTLEGTSTSTSTGSGVNGTQTAPMMTRLGVLGSYSHRTKVPFVVTLLSISLAVPCVLIALSRTTRQWRKVVKRTVRHSAAVRRSTRTASTEADKKKATTTTTTTMKKKKEGGHVAQQEVTSHLATVSATFITNALEVTLIMLSIVLPLSLMYLVYLLTHSLTPNLLRAVEQCLPALVLTAAVLLLLSFIPYIASVGVPSFVITLRITLVTFAIYGMAILTASANFAPALLWPRASTLFCPACLCVLSIFGSYGRVRLAVRIAAYATIGYITYQKYKLYTHHYPPPHHHHSSKSMSLRSTMTIASVLEYLVDIAIVSLWLLYLPRYRGKPYYTGAQRSLGFTRFARKYIFADMERYFHIRVLLDDPAVNLRTPENKYLFAFHPHGVYAGTAMMCLHTQEWERKLGSTPEHYVSMHVASIVLSIPVMRDFNMALGALSVSRICVEASLQRGNSVLIVVGGQSEMLHTRMSRTKMTFVTHHIGFVRLAIANRTPIVPVISFAEPNVMGLLQFPSFQHVMLKILGFPFPVIPYGRWWLPLPFRTPITLVVGRPIEIPSDAVAENAQHVEALAQKYFDELRALFYRHRADAGYPEMELEYVNDRLKRRKAPQMPDVVTGASPALTTLTLAQELHKKST